MCGIFCSIERQSHSWPSEQLLHLLKCRGPDFHQRHSSTHGGRVHIDIEASVLALRGSDTVSQPLAVDSGVGVLCWNGEAWSVDGKRLQGNDTQAVSELLTTATLMPTSASNRWEEILHRADLVSQSLCRISGPYAFVFVDRKHDLLFFGRDFLGRRSLLRRNTPNRGMQLSSVRDSSIPSVWAEVEANGIYCVDLLGTPKADYKSDLVRFSGHFSVAKAPYHFQPGNMRSKALDSTAFTPVIPKLSLHTDIPSPRPLLCAESPSVSKLHNLLRHSLTPRLLSIPDLPLVPAQARPAKLAILFSGGLDCTVLARLSHDILLSTEMIDLINVAFENPRVHKSCTGNGEVSYSAYERCPDRITGRASYEELQRVCPERHWRFVAVNIPYPETLEHRQEVINLMHPHDTEMDLSISYALYFAARGAGYVSANGAEVTTYTTTARVLLSGLGADELFGGYQRHATAFERRGFRGLVDELQLDIGRLGDRNLGRDDRVISHWGREVRYPYLDEELLRWAMSIPVTEKCGYGEPLSEAAVPTTDASETLEASKKALRCLAWSLGLQRVAKERKRAIQFGARTAKMESGRTKGTQTLQQ